MIPTLPLPARNRLAEVILLALGDESARRELEDLATDPGGVPWMVDAPRAQVDLLRVRARRATEVIGQRPILPVPLSLRAALDAAAALFDAGLGFEVHELLEPHWSAASGGAREALQGLIQVAVGYQHLANGNVAGARSLIAEGIVRLATGRLEGLETRAFADSLEQRLHDFPARALPAPAFPRMSS